MGLRHRGGMAIPIMMATKALGLPSPASLMTSPIQVQADEASIRQFGAVLPAPPLGQMG